MYVQRNIEVRSRNHCCSGKEISVTHCVCVCVCVCVYVCSFSYPVCNAYASYCRLWPALLFNIFNITS